MASATRKEFLVNAQFSGCTLASLRGEKNTPSFKFSDPQLAKLPKGAGFVAELGTGVGDLKQAGNYIVPVNYHVRDIHVSGKNVTLADICSATEDDAHTRDVTSAEEVVTEDDIPFKADEAAV